MVNRLLLFFVIVLLVISCKVNEQVVPRNLERIYDPSGSAIHPEINTYNNSDTSSVLIEKIFAGELLFNQANPENKMQARLDVIWFLYELGDKQHFVDSLTTTFIFERNDNKKYYLIEIPVKTQKGKDYFLEIINIDKNRKNSQYAFQRIDRSREYNLKDYLVLNKNSGRFLTEPYIKNDIPFSIKLYDKAFDSLNVFFYKPDNKIPSPPTLKDDFRNNFEVYDSIWVCYFDSLNIKDFTEEGMYYFTFENEPVNGVPLFRFSSNFPVVRTPRDLIMPLAYFGYNDSISANDSIGKLSKLAIDNFWLGKAKNIDKSRELIKTFYNRVLFANIYFSSFKAGWQTDRGMIYIIYGLPDYLHKSGNEEKWIYNPTGIGSGISFTFKYYENPFSLNHYILDREKLKSAGWDEAIEVWNKGEVFYYQNQF